MPIRSRPLPDRRVLAWALALAIGGGVAHAQAVDAPAAPLPARTAPADPGFVACPLGAFKCPERPVSFALCRPNALLEFYQPGLPPDALGRETAFTDILAEHVDSSEPSVYHLDGHVRLQRYDQLLHAEHIDYNDRTTAYDARGNVRYQDSAQLLAASRIRGTTMPDHAVADDVRYQLLVSHGNGVAGQAELVDPERTRFSDVTYSTCDPGHRVWEFRASEITTDKTTGEGRAHDVSMRLKGVPFLYLPYFSFPIDNRRKTGFLYPMFGNSGNSGFMFSIPYYLNLAPNYDATLTPQLYSKRGVMLGGQFRYLFGPSRGQLEFDYLPNDNHAGSDHAGRARDIDDGADRYLVRFADRTRLGRDWSFSTSIQHASDKYYFQDFQSELSGYTTPSTLHSRAYVNGSGNWWRASFGVDRYQNVDPDLTDRNMKYRRWPRATFAMNLPLSRLFEFGMDSEAVAFRKDDVVQGNRLDLYPYISAPMQGAAWFVRPKLAYRYTAYELIDDPARYGYSERSPSRALPIASIDSGLIFERDAHLFGSNYTQTLEPRLYYLYVPYRDQSNLPIFDTREMTFDYWQMFSPNRFSGADRQMDANNLTAALTTRLLDDGGIERAALSFGQIRYFSPQKVQRSRNGQPTRFDGSDYVAQLSVQLSERWRLNSAYQWDPNHNRTDVGIMQVQRRLGLDGVLNLSYRYRVNYMEQFDVSTVFPLNERWRLLGRWNVQLRDRRQWQRGDPKTLAALAGIEYDSCCIAVRLLGRHYVRNVHGDTDNAIMLEIQFKGLGSFSPQTEDFLHRAILGYQ